MLGLSNLYDCPKGQFFVMIQSRLVPISIVQKKPLRFILLAFVIILIVFFIASKAFDAKSNGNTATSQPAQVSQSKADGSIGREFIFPLLKSAKEEKQFTFFLQKAVLQDEIVIKGQKATAVKGRDFLIVTIKITNPHNQAFKINTKDYVRLSANNTSEWLAPDIHNDPVEVQAISTKITRIGFPVNESDTQFVLQIGEIGGAKETIALNLK